MRVLAVLFWAALSVSAMRSEADELPLSVGELGTPDRVTVRGNTTFTEAEIVRQLFCDIDVANASYPTAPLDEFRQLLAEKTLAGYQNAGFAEATVECSADVNTGKFLVIVVEGPRYLAGEIEIAGLPAEDTCWLQEKFAKAPTNHDESSLDLGASKSQQVDPDRWLRWPVGKPAWCAPETHDWCQRRIEKLWFERGILFPKFTVAARLDKDRRQAALAIDFADRGQAAVLDDIVIVGNQKNSREDILNFLNLTPGMTIGGDLRKEVADKLAQSGRFNKANVKLPRPSAAGDRLTMTIELAEYAKASRLREPLAREEAALLKLSQWLREFGKSDEEVMVRLTSLDVVTEVVSSPRLGIVGTVRETAERNGDQRLPFSVAMAVAEGRFGIYSAKRRRQVSTAGAPSYMMGTLSLAIHEGPRLDGRGKVNFIWSARTDSPYPCPIRLGLENSAVGLLALPHEYGAQMSWNDDVLTVTYAGRALEFEASTGRLLSFRGGGWGDLKLDIVHCSGEFERRIRQIDELVGDYPNDLDPQHPLTSALTFLSSEALAYRSLKNQAPLQLVHRLLDLGLLQPADEAFRTVTHLHMPDFTVPVEGYSQPPEDRLGQFQYYAGYACSFIVDDLFSRESWPGRLAHDAVFAAVDKTPHLNEDLYYAPPGVGPLWHLLASVVARLAGMNGLAARTARDGLRHMSPGEFKHDCAALGEANEFIRKSAANTVRVLSELNESEAALICQTLARWHLITEQNGAKMAACLAHLRQRPGELRDADREMVLESVWQSAIKDHVWRALRKLAASVPRTTTDTSQSTAQTQDNTSGSTTDKAEGEVPYKPILPFGPARRIKQQPASRYCR